MPAPTLSDLCTTIRKTTGHVPQPLVGSSLTLVGSALYLFGGRPVNSTTPTADLYQLALPSLHWTLISPSPSSPSTPTPRYLHSATAHGSNIIIFGGEGGAEGDGDPLQELGDVLVYDTTTQAWSSPSIGTALDVHPPESRCAHLAALDAPSHSLYIIGGQSAKGRARPEHLRDTVVLDLRSWTWVGGVEDIGRTVGAYRSAVAGETMRYVAGSGGDDEPSSFSEPLAQGKPAALLLYSNSDLKSTRLRRDFDLLTSEPDHTPQLASYSRLISPETLPPGLRFPNSFVLGRHLVVSGVKIDAATQATSLSLWTLDLGEGLSSLPSSTQDLMWKEIEVGRELKRGSWGGSVRWRNSLLALGREGGDMAKDYARRQQTFTHLACVDLEAFGVYQPPLRLLNKVEQVLGLQQLDLNLSRGTYELVSLEGERYRCSRRLLATRWRWLGEQLESLVLSDADSDLEGSGIDIAYYRTGRKRSSKAASLQVTPDAVRVPLDAESTLALLQYLHTLSLATPLQRTLPSLRSLLLFASSEADLGHLRSVVLHTLHEGLDRGTFAASQVYEIATVGGSRGGACTSLQVRALRRIMKDIIKPASIRRDEDRSSIASSREVPSALLNYSPPASPPLTIDVESPVKSHLMLPVSTGRVRSASIASSARSRGSSCPAPRWRSASQPLLVPESETPPTTPSSVMSKRMAWSPDVTRRARTSSPAPSPRLSSFPLPPRPPSPTFAAPSRTDTHLAPSARFATQPTPLVDVLSEQPLPYNSPEDSSPAITHSAKSLTVIIEPPPGLQYSPGGSLALSLIPIAPATFASTFSSIKIRLVGTSTLAGADQLPSRHTVMDVSADADLSLDITRLRLGFALPVDVVCACRSQHVPLPPSGKVLLGGSGMSSAAEGVALTVSYRIEIIAKRKGWTKSVEKIALPFPYPLKTPHPYGNTLPLASDVDSALATAKRLPSSTWPFTSFDEQALRALSASSARLAYSSFVLPSSIIIIWSLTLTLPAHEATNLARLLDNGGLEVHAGRRIVAILGDKGEVQVARTFELETRSQRRQAAVVGGGGGGRATLEVGGWLELGQEEMKALSTCNGQLRHVLVARLSSLHGPTPVVLEALLGVDHSKSSASESRVDLPSPGCTPVAPETSFDLPPRPKRPDPPSIYSETSSLAPKRSNSLSTDLGLRPIPPRHGRRSSVGDASLSAFSTQSSAEVVIEEDRKSAFSRAMSARKAEREAKAARQAREQEEARLRAVRARATISKGDATGRHLPYAGFFPM